MPKTILLADDSSTIRKIVELAFSGTDIRVEAVEKGCEAVAYLERMRPDLILADVVMPAPTGYDLCRRVKAGDDAVPVVLLSSTFEPYDEALAEDCGADRHLIKPFESDALQRTVRELLAPASAAPEPVTEEPEPVVESDAAVDALIAESVAEATEEPAPVADEVELPEVDPALVEAVSRAVIGRMSEQVVREIAREVVPELAERIIRERIRNLDRPEGEDS